MHYRDLRGWLDGVDSFGELRIVEGAEWRKWPPNPNRRLPYYSIRSKIIRLAGAC
jgi:hypothetical protein